MALAQHYCEYKKGLLGKKFTISILLNSDTADVCGFTSLGSDDAKPEVSTVRIPYGKLAEARITNINGTVYIDVLQRPDMHVYCPGFDNAAEICEEIRQYKHNYVQKMQLAEKNKREAIEREQRESQEYYTKCYDFHIAKDNNPFFVLSEAPNMICAIYFNAKKDFNILKIDGNEKTEVCAKIEYDKLHYFEKAGAIHYVSTIEGQYTNFGGNFTGATFSKSATVIGGLLFGLMGLASGALLSAKPSTYKAPTSKLDLSSTIQQVDDKNVILNYYSDVKGQYMDIELPAEIYNFLQTFIPDKKYEIVCELEKQAAVSRTAYPEGANINILQGTQFPKLSMDEFKESVDKLKYMFDAGMITEEVYESKKAELMKQI